MKNEKKYLSELILKHMFENKLDQKTMAYELGVQPATLCGWLNPSGHGITKKNAERIKFVCRDVIGNAMDNAKPVDCTSAIENFRVGIIRAIIKDGSLSADALKTVLEIIENYKAN